MTATERGSPSGADPVRERARRAPDEPAVFHAGGAWSWKELDRRVEDAARRLRGGAGAGRRVALVLENGPDAVALLHAAARASLQAAPLSPKLTARELAAAFRALDPGLIVCGEGSGAAVREAASEAGAASRLVGVDGLAGLPAADGDLDAPALDAVRAVLWTSGTTGRPRGVLLTGGNLRASARAAAARLDLSAADRWYASLSVAHVGGLALVTRAAWLGSAVVVRAGFDPVEFVALARAGRVSHASFVPVMLRRVLDATGDEPAPASLRALLLGGAPTPRELLERALDAGWPVSLTYGQTEASSQIATAPPERVRAKPGSVGRPLEGVEVRIVASAGPPGPGEDGPDGEAHGSGVGEIRVRGATVAAGYLGPDPLPLDDEGWLRTGDRGRIDADGDLWVTGRLSERIVTGGVTVDPAEVEGVLRALPGVSEAAVVGVPDPEWGEAVAAAVVPEGHRPEGTGGAPEGLRLRLDAHARERLAGPKRPRRVRFLQALPRTPTGKVDRGRLRALLSEEGGGPDP